MSKLNKLAKHWQLALRSQRWEKEAGAQRLLTSTVSWLGGLCCKWGDNDARLKPFDCYIYFWNESYAVELKIMKNFNLKFQPHQLSIIEYCALNNIQNHLIGVVHEECGEIFCNFYTARGLKNLAGAGNFRLVS